MIPDVTKQPNMMRPEMPRIPGVNDVPARTASPWTSNRFLILAAALVAVGGLAGWSMIQSSRSKAGALAKARQLEEAKPAPEPFIAVAPSAPAAESSTIAKLQELSVPWSSKKFDFVDPVTHAHASAMVIRLPGPAATRREAYWAFSLAAPYGRCDLDYVTSVAQIASRFSFHTSHPMIVAPCDGTVYDPLKLGTVPSGALVRGEVVQGSGVRPPMAIEVHVQGQFLIADSIEQ